MAHLNTNQPDGNNPANENTSPNAKSQISDKCSKFSKSNCDTVYNNHNHLPNSLTYTEHLTTKFMLLHQNIWGLSNKIDEFQIAVSPIAPQVICLTEHHLTTEQIRTIKLDQFTLGASSCRQTYKHGVTCIYVSKDIQFHTINLDQFNTKKNLEICALRSSLTSCNLIIICIYRSPIGNFNYFLNQLETVLKKLHKTSTDIIVCGDFNVNYFNYNSRKLLLDSLFASYSLFSTVNFPTRNFNNSSSLIYIYINTYTHDFLVQPFINGLSDHDAQTITLTNIFNSIPRQVFYYNRKIDSITANNFALMLWNVARCIPWGQCQSHLQQFP